MPKNKSLNAADFNSPLEQILRMPYSIKPGLLELINYLYITSR